MSTLPASLDEFLGTRPDRCAYGYAPAQHPGACECGDSEWHIFTRAIREAVRDDGTVSPTAAGGSIPFAPEATLPALMAMAERYGPELYTAYGFRDAFNPTLDPERQDLAGVRFAPDDFVLPGKGWVNAQYLGIDQGPILIMAENYRTGLVW